MLVALIVVKTPRKWTEVSEQASCSTETFMPLGMSPAC